MKPSVSLAAAITTVVLAAGCAVDDGSESTTQPPAPTMTVTETAAADEVAVDDVALDETEEPKQKAKAKREPKPRLFLVTRVVDGDTVELGNGQQVRVVGIDTPEQGECGYEAASNHMADLVLFKKVVLTISDEDTDRYGRLLRYVDVGDIDAGLNQIRSGFAIARYDSRDGYGEHPREAVYIKADKRLTQFECEQPAPAAQPTQQQGGGCHPGYSPCLPIVADLNCGDVDGPITVLGDDPYQFDADGDGTGCDS